MTNNNLAKVEKGWERGVIASKIANDLPHASYVNLGIGMPELVSQYIKEDREIIYHSENGLLGMGPTPNENEIDFDLINAGKKPVTILPGGSFCHHSGGAGDGHHCRFIRLHDLGALYPCGIGDTDFFLFPPSGCGARPLVRP